jgi:FtsH-binding integral membrane protein
MSSLDKFLKFSGLCIVALFISATIPFAVMELYDFMSGIDHSHMYNSEEWVGFYITGLIILWVIFIIGLQDSIYNSNEEGE